MKQQKVLAKINYVDNHLYLFPLDTLTIGDRDHLEEIGFKFHVALDYPVKNKSVAKALQQSRRAAGVSQEDAAEVAFICSAAYGQREQCKAGLTPREAEAYAKKFGTTVNYIFGKFLPGYYRAKWTPLREYHVLEDKALCLKIDLMVHKDEVGKENATRIVAQIGSDLRGIRSRLSKLPTPVLGQHHPHRSPERTAANLQRTVEYLEKRIRHLKLNYIGELEEIVDTRKLARMAQVSEHQARRLMLQLGGRKIGNKWALPADKAWEYVTNG